MKQALEKAQPVFAKWREGIMNERREAHEQELDEFVTEKGEELKAEIIEKVMDKYNKKIWIMRANKEAEERRKKRDEEIAAKESEKRMMEEGSEWGFRKR